MAGSYVLPQVKVWQEFALAPNDVTQNLNPFIIGPYYHLIRYSEDGEREDCRKRAYPLTPGDVLKWVAIDAGKVDKAYAKVTLADAVVSLSDEISVKSGDYRDFISDTAVIGVDDEAEIKLECLDDDTSTGSGKKFKATFTGAYAGKTFANAFRAPVLVGDYINTGTHIAPVYAKITGVAGDTFTVASSVEYEGATFEFVRFGVGLTCTDDPSGTSGHGTKFTVTLESGKSLTGETGDPVFGVPVKAGDFLKSGTDDNPVYIKIRSVTDNTLVTTESIKYTGMSFDVVRKGLEVEVPKDNMTVSDTGVKVDTGITHKIGMFEKPVRAAMAYLTQRSLMTGMSDGIYTVSNDTDITRALGSISPDNPLAYALHVALLNCASAAVRYLAISSDDIEGWRAALNTASRSTDVYAFCPLTEDKTIIDEVVGHCKRMSEPAEKSWRIAIFSLPTPDGKDVTPVNGNTKEWCKVTIPDGGETPVLLTCYKPDSSPSSAHLTDTVVPGDVVTVIKTNGEPATGVVKEVKTDTTLELEAPIEGASNAVCALTITHKYGEAEYVTACADTSRNFMSHRAYNVFPNMLRDTDGNLVSGMFGAAAVTGLACSVLPQQPITNVEIVGFSDLSASLSRFSREQLNEIAGGGTLILMQDKTGGTVYVRHQISTAYSGKNLNKTELSMIKNLDSVSYYFANRCAPYHGRYNVTDDLLTELTAVINDGLSYLETTNEGNKLIGPQLIADGTELKAIYQDPTHKDHVIAQVSLNLPAPFNNLDLYLFVI